MDDSCLDGITYQSQPVATVDLPDVINNSLAEITASIPALDRRDLDTLRNQLGHCPDTFHVPVIEVFDKLKFTNRLAQMVYLTNS